MLCSELKYIAVKGKFIGLALQSYIKRRRAHYWQTLFTFLNRLKKVVTSHLNLYCIFQILHSFVNLAFPKYTANCLNTNTNYSHFTRILRKLGMHYFHLENLLKRIGKINKIIFKKLINNFALLKLL